MSGYDYDLMMSNNAVDAYDEGLKPLSQFHTDDFHDLGISKAFAIWLANTNKWRPCEWHHSSSFYNKTHFYSLDHLKDLLEDENKRALYIFKYHAKNKSKPEEPIQVEGSFDIWGGSMNNRKRVGKKEFTGTLKGNWIHLDGGGRKKASGNYITWREI